MNTYTPVFCSVSSTVLVAPLVSTLTLLQNLTAANLFEGFYVGADCAETVSSSALRWSSAAGGDFSDDSLSSLSESAGSARSNASGGRSRFINVYATVVQSSAVFLCACVAVDDSVVPVAAGGFRIVQQPFFVPAAAQDAPLSTAAGVWVGAATFGYLLHNTTARGVRCTPPLLFYRHGGGQLQHAT